MIRPTRELCVVVHDDLALAGDAITSRGDRPDGPLGIRAVLAILGRA